MFGTEGRPPTSPLVGTIGANIVACPTVAPLALEAVSPAVAPPVSHRRGPVAPSGKQQCWHLRCPPTVTSVVYPRCQTHKVGGLQSCTNVTSTTNTQNFSHNIHSNFKQNITNEKSILSSTKTLVLTHLGTFSNTLHASKHLKTLMKA